MNDMKSLSLIFVCIFALCSCGKDEEPDQNIGEIFIDSVFINNVYVPNQESISQVDYLDVEVRVIFRSRVDTSQVNKKKIFFTGGPDTLYTYRFEKNASTLIIYPGTPLSPYSTYRLVFDVGENLGGTLKTPHYYTFHTRLDTTPKSPAISNDSLLTLVQYRTFQYFWDYAHPVSGLARERLGSGDVVTSGGSGFGLMAILAGIERGFITREQGLERFSRIVNFLIDPETDTFHGAFPHWMNGSTGKVFPFSTKDNGGDLVETAFLMQGLLTVREYFRNGTSPEQALCDSITRLWENVEWSWYRKNNENVLYWHWSPNYGWDMNMTISGWNEALIVYVLAASSPTYPVPEEVYHNGWARNGAYPMVNGKTFYDITLPLGEDRGGPLFFAHYSFLGLDPRDLSDTWAHYWTQNVAHTRINFEYCKANPKNYMGYGPDCWGLTASDIPGGYSASSPNNDLGVIAPTAALSSFPYTPEESMDALHFFYYILGDKLWGTYGFHDAFSLSSRWFADSYIAIDQGPIAVMIENYRTGLLWDLFMAAPEIRQGLKNLGFSYPGILD